MIPSTSLTHSLKNIPVSFCEAALLTLVCKWYSLILFVTSSFQSSMTPPLASPASTTRAATKIRIGCSTARRQHTKPYQSFIKVAYIIAGAWIISVPPNPQQ